MSVEILALIGGFTSKLKVEEPDYFHFYCDILLFCEFHILVFNYIGMLDLIFWEFGF